MVWYVHRASDGTLVSVGTVLADPLPPGLAAKDLPAMRDDQEWNPATKNLATRAAPAPDVDRVNDFLAIATFVDGRLTAAQRTQFRTMLGAFLGPYRFRDPSEPATGLR